MGRGGTIIHVDFGTPSGKDYPERTEALNRGLAILCSVCKQKAAYYNGAAWCETCWLRFVKPKEQCWYMFRETRVKAQQAELLVTPEGRRME